jgi:hypothetical protein
MGKLHIAAFSDNICRPNTSKLDKLAKRDTFIDFFASLLQKAAQQTKKSGKVYEKVRVAAEFKLDTTTVRATPQR